MQAQNSEARWTRGAGSGASGAEYDVDPGFPVAFLPRNITRGSGQHIEYSRKGIPSGGVAEWSKATVLKTVAPQKGAKGSNPFSSSNLDGNPQRAPKPSRALAPAGEARLRLRDHGNPERVRFALRHPTRHPIPLASPFGDFGTCTFPTTAARYARSLALGLAKPSRDGRARSARGAGVGRVGPWPPKGALWLQALRLRQQPPGRGQSPPTPTRSWEPSKGSHLRSGRISSSTKHPRRGGREAEGGGLLNRYTGENLYREFESHPLRQNQAGAQGSTSSLRA